MLSERQRIEAAEASIAELEQENATLRQRLEEHERQAEMVTKTRHLLAGHFANDPRMEPDTRLDQMAALVINDAYEMDLELEGNATVLADADRRAALLEGERVALWGIVDSDGSQREAGRGLVELVQDLVARADRPRLVPTTQTSKGHAAITECAAARDVAQQRGLPFADSASLPMLITVAADLLAEETQRANAMAERAGQLKAQLDELMARHETLRQAARAQAVTVTHLLDVAGVDAQA